MITFLIGVGIGYLVHALVSAQELIIEWRKIRVARRRITDLKRCVRCEQLRQEHISNIFNKIRSKAL